MQDLIISDSEYRTIKEWYNESSKLLRYFVSVSFIAIGFSITIINTFENTHPLELYEKYTLVFTWVLLGSSSTLGGVGMILGYWWLENITRLHIEDLIDKFGFQKGSVYKIRFLGTLVLSSTILSATMLFSGLSSLVAFSILRLYF